MRTLGANRRGQKLLRDLIVWCVKRRGKKDEKLSDAESGATKTPWTYNQQRSRECLLPMIGEIPLGIRQAPNERWDCLR